MMVGYYGATSGTVLINGINIAENIDAGAIFLEESLIQQLGILSDSARNSTCCTAH